MTQRKLYAYFERLNQIGTNRKCVHANIENKLFQPRVPEADSSILEFGDISVVTNEVISPKSGPEVITFFMLNSAEHEICPAN